MSQQMRNGYGFDFPVPVGQSMLVSSITGTYTATIVAGPGKGTALATDSTGGGTYGPYSGGVVIRLQAGANSLIDYDIAVSPALTYAGPLNSGYNSSGDVASAVDGAGKTFPLGQRANGVLLVGDSITANNIGSGYNYAQAQNIGPFNWANAFMGQRLEIVGNIGVAGRWVTGASGMAATIVADLALYPSAKYVCILAGTNDISNDVSYADIVTGLSVIIGACVGSGKTVLLSTILPRAAAGITSAQRLRMNAVNAWIRERQNLQDGVLVSDPFRYLADPTSATGDPIAADYYDTPALHPGPSGAMKIGEVWAADWGPYIPVNKRLAAQAGDIYDATDNPFGNLLSNGALQTLGATSGTGYAGNNPTGWTVQRVAGTGTWTGSAVARTDGVPGNWYQAAIAGETSASAQYQLRQNVFGPNGGGTNTYAIGDQLFAEMELKVAHAGATNYVKGVYITATEYDRDGNVVFVANGLYRYGGTNPMQRAKDYSIVVRTPKFASIGSAGAGTSNQRVTVSADVLFDGSVSAALTLSIGQINLRKAVAA